MLTHPLTHSLMPRLFWVFLFFFPYIISSQNNGTQCFLFSIISFFVHIVFHKLICRRSILLRILVPTQSELLPSVLLNMNLYILNLLSQVPTSAPVSFLFAICPIYQTHKTSLHTHCFQTSGEFDPWGP